MPSSHSGGGSGYVRNITFEDYHVEKVDYPILIDQCYSTSAQQCKDYPSTLSISNITYKNVHGTSSGLLKNGTVVELLCSGQCKNIVAKQTNITSPSGPSQYLCRNLANESLLDFKCTAA